MTARQPTLLRRVGPGLLVAATGVGAGDLATAAFAGSRLGTTVLWAVVVGAGLKFVLTEGLARWQLVTGETLLEGCARRLGRWTLLVLFAYLLPWTFFVGSALLSACGVTAQALLPVFASAETGKVVFGIAHGLAGLVLVLRGGFRWFERSMAVCVGAMFLVVVATALLLGPDLAATISGLRPGLPGGDGTTWTVALMGGVGGTLTILCYGYWIREEGREGEREIAGCRLDLVVGYAVTALFGLAMVTIGSTVVVDGSGADLIVQLAGKLAEPLGPAGRWIFLLGAWGAVFSSLYGVWQAVPYIFADAWALGRGRRAAGPVEQSRPYRGYLLALATVPALGLLVSFREIQKLYAVVGALFIPLLAVVLLVLGGRRAWMGAHRNRPATVVMLLAALLFFLFVGWQQVQQRWGP